MTITTALTIDDQVGLTATERDDITRVVNYAMGQWSAVLAGNATAQVRVQVLPNSQIPSGRADGAPGATIKAATLADGRVVAEGLLSAELRTGQTISFSEAPDINIRIAVDHLRNELWFDPSPASADDIPVGKTDAVSVLIHELGHGLGFTGFGQPPSGTNRSPYDLRVTTANAYPFFNGPNTLAVFGAAVPLTTGNYAHYGNTISTPGTDPLNGLMNGVVFYRGTRYAISDLDLAFMADVGLGTVRDDIFDQTWLGDLDGGAGNDTFRADYSTRTDALNIIRDQAGDFFLPSSLPQLATVHLRNVEKLDLKLGSGDDTIQSGSGNDRIDGGPGLDTMVYSSTQGAYTITANLQGGGGWIVRDDRTGSPDGTDTLTNIEHLRFSDGRTVNLSAGASLNPAAPITAAFANVLRLSPPTGAMLTLQSDLVAKVTAGQLTEVQAYGQIIQQAAGTTSVAVLAYQYFTGKIPGAGGIDYLVSPTGVNPANLNSAYYQAFSLENRYINFAVNLGKNGEGRAAFEQQNAGKTLFETAKAAYATIFGATPTDAKVHALIDSRVDYFASYGGDGADGLGTKAAMVGWLLVEAVKADVGSYAKSNDAFLADLVDGATFAVNLVGVYGSPSFAYSG